jgi:hypothetical protein
LQVAHVAAGMVRFIPCQANASSDDGGVIPNHHHRQSSVGMATHKLSANSVSKYLYPRLISDIRTRIRYPYE